MKVVKRRFRGDELSTITIRIPNHLMKELDRISEKAKTTRQSVIASILEKALADKNLIIEV